MNLSHKQPRENLLFPSSLHGLSNSPFLPPAKAQAGELNTTIPLKFWLLHAIHLVAGAKVGVNKACEGRSIC